MYRDSFNQQFYSQISNHQIDPQSNIKEILRSIQEFSENEHKNPLTILGKATPFKYQVLSELFGVHQDPYLSSLANGSLLEIAQSSLTQNLVCNFNTHLETYSSEENLNLISSVCLTSDPILFVSDLDDFNQLDLARLFEVLFKTYSSLLSQQSQRKNIIVIIKVPKTFLKFWSVQDDFTQRAQEAWTNLKLMKPSLPNMQDLLKFELISSPGPEDDEFWFKEKLRSVSKLLITTTPKNELSPYVTSEMSSPSMTKKVSPQVDFGLYTPGRYSTTSNPEFNSFIEQYSSPRRLDYNFSSARYDIKAKSEIKPKETEKRSFFLNEQYAATERKRSFRNEPTGGIQGIQTRSFVNEPLQTRSFINEPVQRRSFVNEPVQTRSFLANEPTEKEFEDVRKNLYKDVLFDLIKLRNTVKQNSVLENFAIEGRALYDKTMQKFDIETLRFRHLPIYQDKRSFFLEKINNDLHEMYETQVNYIQQLTRQSFQEIFQKEDFRNFTNNRFETARYSLSLEIDNLINDFTRKVTNLRVFGKEEGARWDPELLIEGLRRDFQRSKTENLHTIFENFLSYIDAEMEQKTRELIESHFSSLKRNTLQELTDNFNRLLSEKENAIHTAFQNLLASTRSEEQEIHSLRFREKATERFRQLLSEKTGNLESVLVKDFGNKVLGESEKRKHNWRVSEEVNEHHAFVERTKEEHIEILRQFHGDERTVNGPLNSHQTKSLLSNCLINAYQYKQICQQLETETGKSLSRINQEMKAKSKQETRQRIVKEILFWVLWIFFLYVQIEFLHLAPLWGFLGVFLIVKIVEYSGFPKKLRHKKIDLSLQNPPKSSFNNLVQWTQAFKALLQKPKGTPKKMANEKKKAN